MLGVCHPGLPRTLMTHILEELTHKMQGQPPKKRCQLGSTYVEVLSSKLFPHKVQASHALLQKLEAAQRGKVWIPWVEAG